MRDRAWNRKTSIKKALRKKRITEEVYSMCKEFPWYDNLNQYSKNKVHCSCPMCRGENVYKRRRQEESIKEAMTDCLCD